MATHTRDARIDPGRDPCLGRSRQGALSGTDRHRSRTTRSGSEPKFDATEKALTWQPIPGKPRGNPCIPRFQRCARRGGTLLTWQPISRKLRGDPYLGPKVVLDEGARSSHGDPYPGSCVGTHTRVPKLCPTKGHTNPSPEGVGVVVATHIQAAGDTADAKEQNIALKNSLCNPCPGSIRRKITRKHNSAYNCVATHSWDASIDPSRDPCPGRRGEVPYPAPTGLRQGKSPGSPVGAQAQNEWIKCLCQNGSFP